MTSLETKESEINEQVKKMEEELEALMNNKEEMKYAYITEADT